MSLFDDLITTIPTRDPNECWPWPGHLDRGGYGRTAKRPGLSDLAHRAVYQVIHGSVPNDLPLDHLCRNRACVNPNHLEPVSHRINALRSPIAFVALNLEKTHCPHGHPYDVDNTYVYESRIHTRRCCRACNREAAKRYKARSAS